MAHIDFDEFLKTLDSKPDKKADFLLLTCMDFRFFLKVSERMKGRKYDHVILAGAALGVVQDKKEHWGKTFFDHLGLAIELHEIHTVIVMEHRDCGAYGPPPGFGKLPEEPDPDDERRVHCEQVELLRKEIHKYDSELKFCSFLLDVPDPTQDPTFDQLD
ncbi:MAG TPA: carbonic anhydrase [Pyrinomonadaceae bacterium]|nr:carbonic anhydrase [Pyrinomonadaceae bacterium]